jgi:hypothetical protein
MRLVAATPQSTALDGIIARPSHRKFVSDPNRAETCGCAVASAIISLNRSTFAT